MGRAPRPQAAGLTYHLTARGNARRRIFVTEDDHADFLRRLGAVAGRYEWTCLSYCLMGNHVHLAVRTARPNLADGMRDLLGRYATRFNREHGRSDHLFGRRYHSVVVTDDAQLLAVLRYIARNPVRAGLVAEPAHWRWGSSPAILGRASAPAFLAVDAVLELLAPERREARTRFRDLVTARDGTSPVAAPIAA
jgi:REP element-mobilizing transposase RayT